MSEDIFGAEPLLVASQETIDERVFPTLAEIYSKYSVEGDFGLADKGGIHDYIPTYDRLFAPLRDKEIVLFEIGANQCHSLKMWREYFTSARIVGIDIWNGSRNYITGETIEVLCGDATKPELLDLIGDAKFDIVIDDGSHQLNDQFASYELLKSRMNKGGIYIIEDLINFEVQKPIFEEMGFEIIDLRANKNRFDDVLAIKKF